VTSERKIQANRANASSSTGPRTRDGRARSATNSLRHGLSLPIQVSPLLYEEAHALARRIAGPRASANVKMLALRVAEAEVDLRRARTRRQLFLSGWLSDPNFRPPTKVHIGTLRDLRALGMSATAGTEVTSPPLGSPEKLAAIMLQETESILRIDRYEQRARSRLKFAIRDFDEARGSPILRSS
jgi:hypothetical protein